MATTVETRFQEEIRKKKGAKTLREVLKLLDLPISSQIKQCWRRSRWKRKIRESAFQDYQCSVGSAKSNQISIVEA